MTVNIASAGADSAAVCLDDGQLALPAPDLASVAELAAQCVVVAKVLGRLARECKALSRLAARMVVACARVWMERAAPRGTN